MSPCIAAAGACPAFFPSHPPPTCVTMLWPPIPVCFTRRLPDAARTMFCAASSAACGLGAPMRLHLLPAHEVAAGPPPSSLQPCTGPCVRRLLFQTTTTITTLLLLLLLASSSPRVPAPPSLLPALYCAPLFCCSPAREMPPPVSSSCTPRSPPSQRFCPALCCRTARPPFPAPSYMHPFACPSGFALVCEPLRDSCKGRVIPAAHASAAACLSSCFSSVGHLTGRHVIGLRQRPAKGRMREAAQLAGYRAAQAPRVALPRTAIGGAPGTK